MKKLAIAVTTVAALTGSALAADMPVKASVYKAVDPGYGWTGFYIGLHGGYGWADKSWSEDGVSDGSHTAKGFLGGGQIGYNWQTGPWVFGIEGDVSWADLSASHIEPPPGDFSILKTKVESLGTVAGRIGYAWNNKLLYVKGGWAWVHDKFTDNSSTTGELFGAASDTRSGWMAGVGWEYGFTPNWSAKIEYNFMDFGSKRLFFGGGTDSTIYDIDQQIHVVKLGINYRFGDVGKGPVYAKY